MRFGIIKAVYEISNDGYEFKLKLGDNQLWDYHTPLLGFFAISGV